jgi:translation initiation factor 3 subunit A
MSKRAPKASMMASFYDKMAKVFAVGNNFLFHAASYGKLYALHAARVALTGAADGSDAELEKLASLVLVSALAVPLGSGVESVKRNVVDSEEGESKGRLGRLASLIGLGAAPTRAGLITDALNRHVLKRVSPELRQLYNILEVDFHPLSITSKIEPILKALEDKPETARYVAPLKDVVLARLFQQLAQVYASLKIERVVKLASFAADSSEKDDTRKRVERYVTEACRRGDVDVTIDHASGSIKFDEDLFGDESGPVASTSAGYDSVKTLQPSASTLLRTHLARLAATLHSTLNEVASPQNAPSAVALSARQAAFSNLDTQVPEERDTLLARTQIIKRRKELNDEQSARKEKEEQHARAVRLAQKAEEDAKRQKEEVKKRELERIKKEVEKVKLDEAKKMAEQLESKGLKVDKEVRSLLSLSLSSSVLILPVRNRLSLASPPVNSSSFRSSNSRRRRRPFPRSSPSPRSASTTSSVRSARKRSPSSSSTTSVNKLATGRRSSPLRSTAPSRPRRSTSKASRSRRRCNGSFLTLRASGRRGRRSRGRRLRTSRGG